MWRLPAWLRPHAQTQAPLKSSGSWAITAQITQANTTLVPVTANCVAGTASAGDCLNVGVGGSYLINTGVGQVGRGMPEYHRQLLAQARAAGNSDTSEIVLGENLAVISYNWLAEFSSAQQLVDQLAQTTSLYHFGVGITAQANIQQTGYQGPYVDLPINAVGVPPRISNGSTTTIGGIAYSSSFVAALFADADVLSTLEFAVLLQTMASAGNVTAAASIMLLDANMNSAYSGSLLTTYFADTSTTPGLNYYNNIIYPALSARYTSTDLNNLNNLVQAGQRVPAPLNGSLAVGHWSGAGYTAFIPTSTGIVISQLISGGLSGGYMGTNITDPSLQSWDA